METGPGGEWGVLWLLEYNYELLTYDYRLWKNWKCSDEDAAEIIRKSSMTKGIGSPDDDEDTDLDFKPIVISREWHLVTSPVAFFQFILY